jgi:hypothetical protein
MKQHRRDRIDQPRKSAGHVDLVGSPFKVVFYCFSSLAVET